MRHLRLVIALIGTLSLTAVPAASVDDPLPGVWPLAPSWSKTFNARDAVSFVMGDSRILVVDRARVSALAWSDGAEQWQAAIVATGRPAIDEGRVFVPAGDTIHALSESTGAEVWRHPVGTVSVAPTARAGWLIVSAGDGSLQGINASQGREVWRIDLPAPLATPAVIEGDLVIGACADGVARAWQITDGAVRWTRELGARPVQLLAANGQVFIGTEGGQLFSLRQRDGHRSWVYRLEMQIAGRLATDDRHVYATTIDNSVHALAASNGHRTAHMLLAARVVDGLYADSGNVLVPQSNGEIRIFLARGGNRAGRLTAPIPDATSLAGMMATGSGDRLQMAMTVSADSRVVLTTYRRTGLAAVPATGAPPSTPLLLSLPGGGS